MPQRLALTIGLNSVDPAQYTSWKGTLHAPEKDATAMTRLAERAGFTMLDTLLGPRATSEAVLTCLQTAAARLEEDDLFLLTYAGHGSQMPDMNGDEEEDGQDETWCLFDRELVDDELCEQLATFRAGVRVLVLVDSCHSGSSLFLAPSPEAKRLRDRLMPEGVAADVMKAHRAMYEKILTAPAVAKDELPPSVVLIAACQDNQLAREDTRHGVFTGRLLKVWNDGAFNGSLRDFFNAVRDAMPSPLTQLPKLTPAGAPADAFLAARPFTG